MAGRSESIQTKSQTLIWETCEKDDVTLKVRISFGELLKFEAQPPGHLLDMGGLEAAPKFWELIMVEGAVCHSETSSWHIDPYASGARLVSKTNESKVEVVERWWKSLTEAPRKKKHQEPWLP